MTSPPSAPRRRCSGITAHHRARRCQWPTCSSGGGVLYPCRALPAWRNWQRTCLVNRWFPVRVRASALYRRRSEAFCPGRSLLLGLRFAFRFAYERLLVCRSGHPEATERTCGHVMDAVGRDEQLASVPRSGGRLGRSRVVGLWSLPLVEPCAAHEYPGAPGRPTTLLARESGTPFHHLVVSGLRCPPPELPPFVHHCACQPLPRDGGSPRRSRGAGRRVLSHRRRSRSPAAVQQVTDGVPRRPASSSAGVMRVSHAANRARHRPGSCCPPGQPVSRGFQNWVAYTNLYLGRC